MFSCSSITCAVVGENRTRQNNRSNTLRFQKLSYTLNKHRFDFAAVETDFIKQLKFIIFKLKVLFEVFYGIRRIRDKDIECSIFYLFIRCIFKSVTEDNISFSCAVHKE